MCTWNTFLTIFLETIWYLQCPWAIFPSFLPLRSQVPIPEGSAVQGRSWGEWEGWRGQRGTLSSCLPWAQSAQSPVYSCSALIFLALCHENGFLPWSVPYVPEQVLPRPLVSSHLYQTVLNKSLLSGRGELTRHFSKDVFPVEISRSAANVIYKKVSWLLRPRYFTAVSYLIIQRKGIWECGGRAY